MVDPSQGLNEPLDVAFHDGRVATIGKSIPDSKATEVVDAQDKYVVPGLIDLHVHNYWGVSHYGIDPDITNISKGVTTAIDAGSAGAATFAGIKGKFDTSSFLGEVRFRWGDIRTLSASLHFDKINLDFYKPGAEVNNVDTSSEELLENTGVVAPNTIGSVQGPVQTEWQKRFAESRLGKRLKERPELLEEFNNDPRAFILKYANDDTALYGPRKNTAKLKEMADAIKAGETKIGEDILDDVKQAIIASGGKVEE